MDVRIYQQEVDMLEGVKQWRTRRRILSAVTTALDHHQGFAGNGWPLTVRTTAAEQTQTASEVRAWLAAQLPGSAMPHGIHGYSVSRGVAHMENDRRTYLGKQPFPDFTRAESLTALDQIETAIQHLDLTPMPTITLRDVSCFSIGAMITPALDEDPARHTLHHRLSSIHVLTLRYI
jgi:hypothetical protein